MAYKYSLFNPEESRVAQELLNMPPVMLLNRYLKKKSDKPTRFFASVKTEVNRVDNEDYLINPSLASMEGANLDYVATQVYLPTSQIFKMGYELKIDKVVRDLDRLFEEHTALVNKISKDSPIQPISQDVAYFFKTEILTDKIIKSLENASNTKLI